MSSNFKALRRQLARNLAPIYEARQLEARVRMSAYDALVCLCDNNNTLEKQILRQASKIIKMKKDMAKMKKEMEEMEEMKKGILEFKEFLQDGDYRDEWNNSLADYLR